MAAVVRGRFVVGRQMVMEWRKGGEASAGHNRRKAMAGEAEGETKVLPLHPVHATTHEQATAHDAHVYLIRTPALSDADKQSTIQASGGE